ncbi:hypothetical protein J3R83DRAFT_6095 [Lanmaoa asiatica]|nr:hypothetical protein J3R83DRAFT_6095 [Lanmaoa asiatica]
MSTTSSTKSTPLSHDAPSVRLNESAAAKEVRAHEHARHRIKERREHTLAKERKSKAAAVRVLGIKVSHGAKLVRKHSMENWDGEEPEERRSAPAMSVQDAVPVHEQEQEHRMAPPRDSTGSFTELTLGDLISRPRRPKAKQLDFEVIPPIRAVIALDDVEADEPWEYITRASLNDGSAWVGKSYAQAVASAM